MPDSHMIKVDLTLTADTPNSMNFADAMAGLNNPWYRFEATEGGSVELWANPEGYEYLARYFLKLARSGKAEGYHAHHTLEYSHGPSMGDPELTIGVASPAQ